MSAYKYYDRMDEMKEQDISMQTVVGTAVEVEPLKTTVGPTVNENFVPGLKTKPLIDYKYNEGELLQEITDYINGTYSEHYAQGKIQSTEIAIDRGRGTGFCMGNVDKYSQRYGRKGDTPAEWRKDLMKVIHYAIIQLYIHDQEYKD